MKNTGKILILIFLSGQLCGFTSGVSGRDRRNHPQQAAEPVLEYEETVYPQKSFREQYEQYYLLVVSSLEEARLSLGENQQLAHRMAHNSGNYFKLLQLLVKSEFKKNFEELNSKLLALRISLKKTNLSSSEKDNIVKELEIIEKKIKLEFGYERTALWIKD
ncbi:MAG: hypothetical protein HY810_03040 [Candidatus Omnitrophica bacterium]|nr:hypothetical protein [Candidatus Omnitrophota bacterium]